MAEDNLMQMRAYRRIGSALPASMVNPFARMLKFAGIRSDVRVWLGMRLFLAFLSGSIALLAYLTIYNPIATVQSTTIALVLFLSGFGIVLILYYLALYFKTVDRTSTVERVLPDLLMLTVSNLRAGMSPFPAFVSASRPEFGALDEEVKKSTAKAGGTTSLVDTLDEIGTYFDSDLLRRTISLFRKGIRSGGQLARLLRSNAEEVRRIQDMRAELAASTRTYAIFMGFIIVIVMPFLLSVSSQFLSVFLTLGAQTSGQQTGLPGNISSFSGKVLITLDEMNIIAIGTLIVTSLLASALLGIIIRGRALYGVKYFPTFAIASIIFFFIAKYFIGGFLSAFSS